MSEHDENDIANDRIRGAKNIGKFIGEDDDRRVYRLLETGVYPAGKEGASWIASKRKLRARHEELTGGAAE